jgi:hypothetical protein
MSQELKNPVRMTGHRKYPLSFLPPPAQKRLFWVLLGLVVVLMTVFRITGAPMNTGAAPYGVVSFELAGSLTRAQAVLASWDAPARIRAAFGLGLDFLFIPVYAGAISLGCALASGGLQARKWPLAALGNIFAWGVVLAGLLDVIENYALTVILFGSITAPWPQIAAWCAGPKFVLIFLGLVYALYGGAVSLAIKAR